MIEKTMRIICSVLAVIIMATFSNGLQAQSGSDLRINEILVLNDSSYVDDFGVHSPWIEIFNTAYNTVDIGGMYLTNDISNPTLYYIPKGDPKTQIAPRSYLVLWADNQTTRGILHLNFDLRNSKVVALYDANGRTLIDKANVPDSHSPDITFGRLVDGGPTWGFLTKNTPMANNNTTPSVSSAQTFGEMDPYGGAMALIAMTVVFSALALLYSLFKRTSKLYNLDVKGLLCRKRKGEDCGEKPAIADEIPGEVGAAIAMALHLYQNQLHDNENTVLTIRKVSRTYSPWSSKIYGLRQSPK